MKTDEELIAEAIAAGKVRKIPRGVQTITFDTSITMHERLRIRRRVRARVQRIRAAEARAAKMKDEKDEGMD